MTQPTPRLIATLDDAKDGIARFQDALKSPEIQGLLGMFRAWYAIEDENGEILLAPSKFIGYQGLTGESYRDISEEIDGRATESVLGRWFSRPASQTEDALIDKLAELLSWYGKTPSKAVRICTVGGATLGDIQSDAKAESERGADPVDAMLVFYGLLSPDDQQEVRRRISEIRTTA